MSEPACQLVSVTANNRFVECRLAVLIDDLIEKVWAALIDPELLVNWLAPGQIDPRLGGRVKLDFQDSGIAIDSTVTAINAGHLLEYSWSGPGEPLRPVRWELEPAGPTTRLTLTLSLLPGEDVARSAAGWAAHLDMLIAALAGIPMKFPFQVFKAARDAYSERVASDMSATTSAH